MFPAHAGMICECPRRALERRDVPRTRGDDPKESSSVGFEIYVPRTRGDDPDANTTVSRGVLCSPHTRG